MTRIIALFAAAAVFLGIAFGTILVFRGKDADRFADCRRGAVAGGSAEIGGPFELTDASGARVSETDVITGPTLVYFGYTFCPDFCPTDLARNALAVDALAEEGISVGQVFVTIDPARDTPDVVRDFTAFIHPDLVGLTGTATEVAAAANAYRVYFSKAPGEDDFYLMDHSTYTYLMAPDEGLLEFYGSDLAPDAVASSASCFAAEL